MQKTQSFLGQVMILIALVLLGIAIMALVTQKNSVFSAFNVTGANVITGGVTEGRTTCNTTTTQVIARNLNRQYAVFVNLDASNTIYISLGNTAATTSSIPVAPNKSSYEINTENLYQGVVNCISENAAANLQYTEK